MRQIRRGPLILLIFQSEHEFLYLPVVIDWYSRCIVGCEVDDTFDTRMVINALKKAFKVAKLQILNSDQGCQFTNRQYINFIKQNGICQSMDGKSRWADDIMIERWFRSFKYEEA
ncbi:MULTISPECIES: DDE-type integrase/transposase/recombinase [Blautia]|uniref:DDE-type integrase/transposase/recombinase n=1 Tax=Blautia TaxID=572511 RepID=UPI001FA9F77E|nr:DDE-type integrase/transposase/recombinase [Blautia marasmi]